MKFYIRLLLTIAAIIMCGISLFIGITSSYRSSKTDAVLLNDITQTVKEQWDDIGAFDSDVFSDEQLAKRYEWTIGNSWNTVVYHLWHLGRKQMGISAGVRFFHHISLVCP